MFHRLLQCGACCLIAAALAALAWPAPVTAETLRLTLSEAFAKALEKGTQAHIARLQAEQAEEEAAEARSAYLPQVSISSRAGYSNRINEKLRAVDGKGRERSFGLSSLGSTQGWFNFTVDQLLFDLSRTKRIETRELAAEVARAAGSERSEEIALDLVQRYTEVLRLERYAALDGERIKSAQWLNRQAGLFAKAGASLAAERTRVSVRLDEVRLQAEANRDRLEQARFSLLVAIGQDTQSLREMDLELAAESLPNPSLLGDNGYGEQDLAQAPDMQILALRKKMEEASFVAARAERLPTLGLRGGYSNFGAKRFDNFNDEWRIGVDLNVPLFDGFRAKHAIARSARAREIARLRYRAALENKRIRIGELEHKVSIAEQRWKLAQRMADNARERQSLADLRLRAREGSIGEALEARVGFSQAAGDAIDTRFEAIRALALLQRTMGRLSATILGPGTKATDQ